MKLRFEGIAAAMSTGALACVLAFPAGAQTGRDTKSGKSAASSTTATPSTGASAPSTARGCDKLTGKTRDDCMEQIRRDEEQLKSSSSRGTSGGDSSRR